MASVLNKRLKTKTRTEPKIRKAATTFDMFQYAGQFVTYAVFDDLKDKKLVENFLKAEIKKLTDEGITEDELKLAKQAEIQSVLEMKKNLGFQESRTELLGEGLLFKNDPDFYFTRLKKQQKLEIKEIYQTTRRLLRRSPARILFKAKN